MEYKDEETFVKVRDIKKIAIRYAKSGWMLVDFLATFPFNLLFEDAVYTRMIRLSRLSKMVAILDVSRVQRMVKSYFDKSTRADRIQTQFILIYNYKIFRLIIIVFMITYLIGSFWWLIVKNVNNIEDVDAGNTFIRTWALDEIYWFDDPHKLCQRENCKAAMKDKEYLDEAMGEMVTNAFLDDCLDKKWREDPTKGRCT